MLTKSAGTWALIFYDTMSIKTVQILNPAQE